MIHVLIILLILLLLWILLPLILRLLGLLAYMILGIATLSCCILPLKLKTKIIIKLEKSINKLKKWTDEL